MPEKKERNYSLVKDVLEGRNLRLVAKKFGISTVRVKQICQDIFRKLLPSMNKNFIFT